MLYKGKIMLWRAIYNIIIRYVCVGVRVRAYVQRDARTIIAKAIFGTPRKNAEKRLKMGCFR